MRKRTGMGDQNTEKRVGERKGEEDGAYGAENKGLSGAEIDARVEDAIRIDEIEHLRSRAPHQRNGGQKQRVAIAGVLAMRPACVILDEATAMLDPSGRAEVLETASTLHRQGVTIVSITHFMSEVPRADRVIVLSGGQIALMGTPRELFAMPERLRALGLDVPQVTQMAAQRREIGGAHG